MLHRVAIIGTAALASGVLLGACAIEPATVAPQLEPDVDALVWPGPPEVPRYAIAGVLIGERDFVSPEEQEDGALETAFKWIVGLAFGERRYKELQRPVSGLTDDAGRVFVVDASHRAVFVFDVPARKLRRWQEAANGGFFVSPVGIAADGRGGVLVTDSELGEIFRLNAEGEPVQRLGKGVVQRPTGIARDAERGWIFVADTARHDIKVFNDGGQLINVIGSRGRSVGEFNSPTHLMLWQNQLYVADTLNFRIQVLDLDGTVDRSFGEAGIYVGNLARPKGVAVGWDGRIYVVESYFDHLLIYDRDGRLLLPIGGTGSGIGQFYLPSGVWTDRRGRVYVADMFNGRVVVLKDLTRKEEL